MLTAEQPFLAQKEDLIAELKASKDITGIKKLKVERAKVEERNEKELFSEITRSLTANSFVEKVGSPVHLLTHHCQPNTYISFLRFMYSPWGAILDYVYVTRDISPRILGFRDNFLKNTKGRCRGVHRSIFPQSRECSN